jgi:predicted nucleic acid-binding protein
MISLDTNILIYATDSRAGVRHDTAHRLISAAIRVQAALTEQSILEFVNVATRKARLPLDEATRIARGYLTHFSLLVPPASIVEDVLVLLDRHKLEVWDARLLAVCAAHGCDYLLSEDMQDGAQYGGVTVVDPFKAVNAPITEQVLRV